MSTLSNGPETNQTAHLARQVMYIRWILAVVLFLIALGFEAREHLWGRGSFDNNFSFEVVFFGVIGPSCSFFVLTWISHKLFQLAEAYRAIQTLNSDLEARIAARTAELTRANEQLRQLDQLKSEFVSLVSHELRAPLTNIQGGLELILQADELCKEPTPHMLRVVQSEVVRLSNLVRQILDVSALEAGHLQLNPGPVAVRPLIHKVAERCIVPDGRYSLKVNVPSQLTPVWADEDRLTDVLANLLNNAVKYSPDGGEIHIGAAQERDCVHLTISDQGVGIPPEDQQQLFGMFYRGRGNGENGTPGYGLGLYFCHKLVAAHNGKIWVESAGIPGEGATFHLTLPTDAGADQNA